MSYYCKLLGLMIHCPGHRSTSSSSSSCNQSMIIIIITIIILQKWKNPKLSRPDELIHASSVSRKRSSLDWRRTTTTMGKSTAVTQHCKSKQVQTRLSAIFLKYEKSSEVVLLTSSSVEIFPNTTSNDKARTIMYKSKEIINLNSINQRTTRLLLRYTCRTLRKFLFRVLSRLQEGSCVHRSEPASSFLLMCTQAVSS